MTSKEGEIIEIEIEETPEIITVPEPEKKEPVKIGDDKQ